MIEEIIYKIFEKNTNLSKREAWGGQRGKDDWAVYIHSADFK